MATSLILALVEIGVPLLVGAVVDSVRSDVTTIRVPGPDGPRIWVVALLGAAVGRGILVGARRAQAGRIGESVASRMRVALWATLQEVTLDDVRARGPGRLMVRFVGDARAVQRAVTEGFVRLAQDMLLTTAVLLALAFIDWRLAAGAALTLPAYGLLFWRLNPRLREASRTTRNRRTRLAAYIHERISGLVVIKASTRQATEAGRVDRLSRDVASEGSRVARLRGTLDGLTTASVGIGAVLVVAVAVQEAWAGRLSGGDLAAAYALIGLLLPALGRIAAANRSLQEAHVSIRRLAETLSQAPEIGSGPGLPALAVSAGAIEFERVSLARMDGQAALEQVGLRAGPGELVGLTGPSGAGTSAILELLIGLRRPDSGRILVDGQDVARVALGSLRSRIGYVAQGAPLLDGSIAENVAYGVLDGRLERHVRRAARLAGLDGLIRALPNGWRTPVGPGGRGLPSAQRRIVALARALAADPPILLIDGADEALDAKAARELGATLRTLARERTVLVVARGRPLLECCDRVCVLERGRIVEEGTFTSLVRRPGPLACLVGGTERSR
jgi:ABC-type multidrug transport system fused ATPase/permease subunit